MYYVMPDGCTVVRASVAREGFTLEDGTEMPEEESGWLFAVHPRDNSRFRVGANGLEYETLRKGYYVSARRGVGPVRHPA